MSKRSLLATLLCLQPVLAHAAEVEQMAAGTFTRDVICDLRIDYGGMFSRNDAAALEKMLRHIAQSESVIRIRLFVAGREGEKAYCISTTNQQATDSVFQQLQKLLPAETTPSHPKHNIFPTLPRVTRHDAR